MTKEIIIDGVNVAECACLDEWNHCIICNSLIKTIYQNATKCHTEQDLRCEQYSNCYYKQLQRLKQENKCKHLVLDECSKTGENCIGLKQCLLKLEQENERLRKLEEIAKEMHESWNEFDVVNERYINSLHKALMDIKEIAERIETECISWTMEIDCNKCKDYSECSKSLVDQILAKIEEVNNV